MIYEAKCGTVLAVKIGWHGPCIFASVARSLQPYPDAGTPLWVTTFLLLLARKGVDRHPGPI